LTIVQAAQLETLVFLTPSNLRHSLAELTLGPFHSLLYEGKAMTYIAGLRALHSLRLTHVFYDTLSPATLTKFTPPCCALPHLRYFD
jgi:hypothetical protein